MISKFLDDDKLKQVSGRAFRAQGPFPWAGIESLLHPEAFDALVAGYPPLELFVWHEGRSGQHYQRPQDRFFLDWKPTAEPGPGVATPAVLPEVWQAFIDELATDRAYRRFLAGCLGSDDFSPQYNWHVGVTGSEVCPHVDKDSKLATHIFYCNTEADWKREWGGSMLVLDRPAPGVDYPDFDDFDRQTVVDTLGNVSFLFRNDPGAWHGVKPLSCPEGHYRRLFNAVYFPGPKSRKALRARRASSERGA